MNYFEENPETLDKNDCRDEKGLELNDLGWLLDHHRAKEHDRRQMVEDMSLQAGDVVLDLGCGPGLWTELLADKVGPEGFVAGVDFSSRLLDYAVRNLENKPYREYVCYREGSFTAIPFADETFDVVFFGNCFMYVDEPAVVIEELKRVAKKGGKIVAKDFDGAVLVIHPIEPELCLRVVTAAARAINAHPPLPYFDNFFGRKLSGLFQNAGFKDTLTVSYAIQKTFPLSPETKRYITNNVMWYLNTGRAYLTQEDIARWESYFDETSQDCIFNNTDFYYCMLEVVTTGMLPPKQLMPSPGSLV